MKIFQSIQFIIYRRFP